MLTSTHTFPKDFVWGAATSAFQIEGAASTDGRAASIWDTFCRQPGAIVDQSNGDVACDHYHHLDADLDLMQRLGLQAYRFSTSWSRVQPDGIGAWNPKGLDFYDRLIDGLLQRGITPYLTLYHWDLPQVLQDQGGWANREVALRFVDYAETMAERYGDRVASIATHNEPWIVATLGHEHGIFAPGIKNRRTAFQVSHHLLLAHGMALLALRAAGVKAPLGIVLNQGPIVPATDSESDRAQARFEDGLLIRWYMDALFHGHYPADVLAHLGDDAPQVQDGDMRVIRTPLDFLGLNYYTRSIVGSEPPTHPPGTELTDMGWEVYPQGLTDLLVRLGREYPLPPLYITENGAAYPDVPSGEHVHDPLRADYLRRHIGAVREAITAGVDVRGYFVWSLFDNFEWAFGYSKRFGMVYVDYASGQRIPKDSAFWYRDFIAAQSARHVTPL
ncbi:GH1 family beta-glucosidase [Piscinibacter sp.]|uniref:GH1 family beta-glucosidase n=1 Tax=Piscinibacter sp. TaxID=1903157 RepID=UPI002D1E02F4|nr:GH1 family beta-glucosidase [Albitalea sp.]HUG23438.1 GH1 family beta-glucosidase [Albitalea sp.]